MINTEEVKEVNVNNELLEESKESKESKEYDILPVTINHLIISGGGPNGLKYTGIIQELMRQDYINIDNIETIYATSAGSILSIILALRFEWDTINNYLINRPWQDAYKITAEMIFSSYSNKGLFDEKVVEIFFKPLFNSKDIPLTITMAEFYELTKIELHFFSIEMNTFEVVDINYKTFPDLPVLKAVLMSSSIPLLFCPVYLEDKTYIDGAIMCNYPLKYCLQDHPKKEEVFGIRNKNIIENKIKINKDTTLLEYITYFIGKLIDSANLLRNDVIENEIVCDNESFSIDFFKTALYSKECRQEMLDDGIAKANTYLTQLNLLNLLNL